MTPEPGQIWCMKGKASWSAIVSFADEWSVTYRKNRGCDIGHQVTEDFLDQWEYLKTTSVSRMLAGLWHLEDQLMDDNCGKGNLSQESLDAMDALYNTYGECLMEEPDEA